jgi:hypothetical protein
MERRIVVSTLPNKALIIFAVNSSAKLVHAWKESSDVDAAWTPFIPMNPDPGQVGELAIGKLSDGRLTLWANTTEALISNWKQTIDTNSPWEPVWTSIDPPQTPYRKGAFALTAGTLSNGALQLFVGFPNEINPTGGYIYTRWKLSSDSNAAWSDWQLFRETAASDLTMTTSDLPDRRLVFWAGGTDYLSTSYPLISAWKATVDANSAWVWEDPFNPITNFSAGSPTAAPLANGALQLWALASSDRPSAQIFSTHKLTPDPNAGWSEPKFGS